FQSKSSEVANNDHSGSVLGVTDDEERYRGCEPLTLSCPGCSGTFDCPSIISYIRTIALETSTNVQDQSPNIGTNYSALNVKKRAELFISANYKGLMTCDDETCDYTTLSLNLRVIGDSKRGTACPNYPRCNGRLVRQYSEPNTHKQFSYSCYLLDANRCIDKVEAKFRNSVEKKVARITPLVELASLTVQKARDRCGYGWVKLGDLFSVS
ncbi:DNA polymerase alpha catalytic subunit, partial [Tanacetum coccineum]